MSDYDSTTFAGVIVDKTKFQEVTWKCTVFYPELQIVYPTSDFAKSSAFTGSESFEVSPSDGGGDDDQSEPEDNVGMIVGIVVGVLVVGVICTLIILLDRKSVV